MNISVDTKQVDDLIQSKLRFLENPEPMLTRIANYGHRSIMKNFREGGRPNRWVPSRERARNRKIRIRNEKKGKASRAQKTLRDTGRLMDSIAFEISQNKIVLGTNVVYAAIHHFGGVVNNPGGQPYINLGNNQILFLRKSSEFSPGKKTRQQKGIGKIKKALKGGAEVKYTKPHKIKIPARPYMMIQPDDYMAYKRIVIDEIGKA